MEVSLHRHANWTQGERAGTRHYTLTIARFISSCWLTSTDLLFVSCNKVAFIYYNQWNRLIRIDFSISFWLQEKCVRYWPAEGSISFGEYNVETKRDTLYETFSLRDLLLTYTPVSYTTLLLSLYPPPWIMGHFRMMEAAGKHHVHFQAFKKKTKKN